MKPVKIIISLIIIVFSLYVVGSSISNLQNIDEKYDAETQELVTELNRVLNKQLDLCTTTDHLGDLKNCKSESIPQMIERCDEQNSNLSICSDVRLKEFSNTIDERIESASVVFSNKLDIVDSEIDALQSELIEHCSIQKYDLDVCKNSMLELKNNCMKEELMQLPSCNDPRIEIFLNKNSIQTTQDTEIINPQTKYEQIPIDTNLQAMYARTVRDCIEDNTVFANNMLAIANLDSINDNDERLFSAYNGAERLNICSADIIEIESNYCYLFNPGCTETGKFETYWEVMPRIQSSFDKICTNTGKLCNYTFHEN